MHEFLEEIEKDVTIGAGISAQRAKFVFPHQASDPVLPRT
jgi:hypothetical protein